jgi:hypothetical protein
MQALHASTSGRTMGYSRPGAAASGTSRRICVRVQAVATAAGSKAVLAPPYNVLITGSTKGVSDAQQRPVKFDHCARVRPRRGSNSRTAVACLELACMDVSRWHPCCTIQRHVIQVTAVPSMWFRCWTCPGRGLFRSRRQCCHLQQKW